MPSFKPVKKNDKQPKIPAKHRVRKTNGLSLEEAQESIRNTFKKLNLTVYKTDGQP